MIVYHSSNTIVESPDIQHSRKYLDFGRGFYLTSIYDQAVRYAQRFKRRGQQAWLNTYELSDSLGEWNILCFESYNQAWLDFVAQCRDGKDVGDYDMVVGGIANDRVIITLDRYFSGEISKEEALGQLRFEKPNIQYCIRSEKMLTEALSYIKSEKI